MKNTKTKIQKPVELDAHLRYICKNPNCGYTHWLSLKEAQTKNFKVVCDCGTVFKPKQVLKLKILYKKDTLVDKAEPSKPDEGARSCFVNLSAIPQQAELNLDILNKCVKILVGYGFTKTESEQLIRNSYRNNPTDDWTVLIKNTLASFGENNHGEERDPSF